MEDPSDFMGSMLAPQDSTGKKKPKAKLAPPDDVEILERRLQNIRDEKSRWTAAGKNKVEASKPEWEAMQAREDAIWQQLTKARASQKRDIAKP